jgi:hypothetical protein
MIKGIGIPLVPNIKALIWHATKPTVVTLRTCGSSVFIGDTTVALGNGFKLNCQAPLTINMATNDDLYAISDNGCNIGALISVV